MMQPPQDSVQSHSSPVKQYKAMEEKGNNKVTSLICTIALEINSYTPVKWVQNMMSHQTKLFLSLFWLKGKVALIRKPDTWGEGRLMF